MPPVRHLISMTLRNLPRAGGEPAWPRRPVKTLHRDASLIHGLARRSRSGSRSRSGQQQQPQQQQQQQQG
jgi:hypothetical protein